MVVVTPQNLSTVLELLVSGLGTVSGSATMAGDVVSLLSYLPLLLPH